MTAGAAWTPSNAAEALKGLALPGGWIVLDRMIRPPDASGGTFSESYLVERGPELGFLKAFDYSQALTSANTPLMLQAMTSAYLYEAALMWKCGGARLSRVVRVLDEGEIDVSGFPITRVNYLIFERASGDVRAHLKTSAVLDLAWKLRTVHQVATGVKQLHQNDITHHDVKPSNILVFASEGAKVGDLGRASAHGVPAPHDGAPFEGDWTYAPPEALYGATSSDVRIRRRASDIYQVGSLLYFLVQGAGVTAMVERGLDPAHHWSVWGDSYAAVLPHIRAAFDDLCVGFEAAVPASVRAGVGTLFRRLCDPDPSRRGDTKAEAGTLGRYSMERFIAELNLAAYRVELELMGKAK